MGCEVTCYNRTGCDNGGLKEYKGVKLKPVFTIHRKGLAAITSSLFATIRATIHSIDHRREKWHAGLGSHYIKIGEKMAVKHASKIIVLSKGVQEYFRETYGRETVFIPNGVSRPQIREAKEITQNLV